jgi:hypothetical protein
VLLALLCVFCGFVGLFGALCGLVCVRSCLCLRGVFNLAWRVTVGMQATLHNATDLYKHMLHHMNPKLLKTTVLFVR